MVKVLKDGNVGKNWKTKVECKGIKSMKSKGCGAELEVETDDLVPMLWYGTHFAHKYPGILCPQCGAYSAVKNVPDSVWGKVSKKQAVFDGTDHSI